MVSTLATWAVLALAQVPAQPAASELNIGDAAPALRVDRWLVGPAVHRFERGRVHVVVFVARWSPQCELSLIHMAQLQRAHNGLSVLGVAIFESAHVEVASWAGRIADFTTFPIVTDDVDPSRAPREGAMVESWMDAAGEAGVPTAFLIDRQGKIAWIGHPLTLDAPLERVIAGEWNTEEARRLRDKAVGSDRVLNRLLRRLDRSESAAEAARWLSEVDALIAADPNARDVLNAKKLYILLETDEAAAVAHARATSIDVAEAPKPATLNGIAWALIDPDRRAGASDDAVRAAHEIATHACTRTEFEDVPSLDTLALATFLSGELAKAVELQERVIALAGDNASDAQRARLIKYRDALQHRGKGK